ncbi:MAG: hypothetical protein H6619_02585 [Deltaproteobacteria bacterium]|nr:hypothetical protein [Deltaproteobacteria bacterium]
MRRINKSVQFLSVVSAVLLISNVSFAENQSHKLKPNVSKSEGEPLLDDSCPSIDFFDVSEADKKEFIEKAQKWINENLPNAKTLDEVAQGIIDKYDTDDNNKLKSSELSSFTSALGYWFCGTVADALLEEFNTDEDNALSKSEISNALAGGGIIAPGAED